VDEAVAHASHGTPFQMAMPLLDLVWELLDRFPNDL
jgi:hypothetical protein